MIVKYGFCFDLFTSMSIVKIYLLSWIHWWNVRKIHLHIELELNLGKILHLSISFGDVVPRKIELERNLLWVNLRNLETKTESHVKMRLVLLAPCNNFCHEKWNIVIFRVTRADFDQTDAFFSSWMLETFRRCHLVRPWAWLRSHLQPFRQP